MAVLVACDLGKAYLKAMIIKPNGSVCRESFKSKVLKLNELEDYPVQGNSYKIEYQGETYLIGDQGVEASYELEKSTINHKLSLFTALSSLVNSGETINLVIGCPASIYKNKESRKNYVAYLTDNKQIKFKVAGDEYFYTVDKVLVLPEGSGAPYVYPSKFQGKRVLIVDFGGLNMQISIADDCTLELDTLSTFNHGYYKLIDMVKDRFSSEYSMPIDDKEADNILCNFGMKIKGKVDEKSVSLLNELCDTYLDKASSLIRSKNFNTDTLEVVFIGGTSEFLGSKLSRVAPHGFVCKDSRWANVEGFYKVAQLRGL